MPQQPATSSHTEAERERKMMMRRRRMMTIHRLGMTGW
jgi:hypothetical protein